MELAFGDAFALSYRRTTLEVFLGELLGAGSVLEEPVEPRATEDARLTDPQPYDTTHTQPAFLAVRLRRP